PMPAAAASVQEQFDTLWSSNVDLSQILAVSGDEPFRTRLLFEALPPEWFEGEHNRRHYLSTSSRSTRQVRRSESLGAYSAVAGKVAIAGPPGGVAQAFRPSDYSERAPRIA